VIECGAGCAVCVFFFALFDFSSLTIVIVIRAREVRALR
jgi:hypothetical protein